MGVAPNHPVMDDHFSIETHGDLGISHPLVLFPATTRWKPLAKPGQERWDFGDRCHNV
jgi:hypothetical protein